MSDFDQQGFVEDLLERSHVVADLPIAAVGGFVSSLLDIADSEGVTDAVIEGLLGLDDRRVRVIVASAIAELAEEPQRSQAQVAAGEDGVEVPSVVAFEAADAWLVRAPFGTSLVTGWSDVDGDAHGVMFELADDDRLNDIVLVEDPAAMIDDLAETDELDVIELAPDAAVRRAVVAWTTASGLPGGFGPSLAANQRYVRRLLERASGEQLGLLSAFDEPLDLSRGMSPEEIADADAAARSTLRAAIGEAAHTAAHPAWVACVRAEIPDLTKRQRAALLWLEWADWLGVGIGLLRGGAGTPTSGEALVDLVNRCPEVSSTIDADDREYATWAFDLAVEHLGDAGLVVDGELSELGHSTLHGSLVAAWSEQPTA